MTNPETTKNRSTPLDASVTWGEWIPGPSVVQFPGEVTGEHRERGDCTQDLNRNDFFRLFPHRSIPVGRPDASYRNAIWRQPTAVSIRQHPEWPRSGDRWARMISTTERTNRRPAIWMEAAASGLAAPVGHVLSIRLKTVAFPPELCGS
jgi:hypothetical protein